MADVTDTFYPATDAMVGYGTQWLIGDGASPETFQAVEAVVSFEAGGETTAEIRTTHLRSPGRHHEVRAGMITSAPFTGSLIFLPESESQSYAGGGTGSFTAGGLAKIAETGEVRSMKLRFRDGNSPEGELAFRGYISEFSPAKGITVEGVITTSVSVMPTESFLSGLPA